MLVFRRTYCKTARTDEVVCYEGQAILLHREIRMILYNIKPSHLCNKPYRVTVFIFIYLAEISDRISCMWIYFKYMDFCQLANIFSLMVLKGANFSFRQTKNTETFWSLKNRIMWYKYLILRHSHKALCRYTITASGNPALGWASRASTKAQGI